MNDMQGVRYWLLILAIGFFLVSACTPPEPTPTVTPTPTSTPAPTGTVTSTRTATPTPTPTPVSLSATKKQQLTSYLEALSNTWDQPSVKTANGILSDPSLGAHIWEAFFEEYFATHPFTDDLKNYLSYPVFWWFDETAHANLQVGLYGPLVKAIYRWTDEYLQTDRSSLTRASPLVQSIMNAHRFLNEMVRLQAPGVDYRDDIFSLYTSLARDRGLIYSATPLDTASYPFAGAFRAQAQVNLRDALPLTSSVRSQIADALGLTALDAEILESYGVLVVDNQRLDSAQLGVIKEALTLVSSELHRLGTITVNDFLGNTGERHLWLSQTWGQAWAINIFGLRVGEAGENVFPDDVPQEFSDIFSLAVAHELNHVVDAYVIEGIPKLKARKEALLKQGGQNRKNYLRSMFEDGFFQSAPQEFFASISVQWFTSSAHTLVLALERLRQGKPEPLNQFLFFAEVYSRGGPSTLFYTLDTFGNLSHQDVALQRDDQGRIVGLSFESKVYRFDLDANGNVTAASERTQ